MPYNTSKSDEGRAERDQYNIEERAQRVAEAEAVDAPLNGNLRDQFAMAALTGLLMRGGHDHDKRDGHRYYELSYEIADGMLEARKPKKP